MRKAISESLGINYRDVRIDRTDKGKPFLQDPSTSTFSFNVSHQGEFAVLAAEMESQVGIDVMQVERPGNLFISGQ